MGVPDRHLHRDGRGCRRSWLFLALGSTEESRDLFDDVGVTSGAPMLDTVDWAQSCSPELGDDASRLVERHVLVISGVDDQQVRVQRCEMASGS